MRVTVVARSAASWLIAFDCCICINTTISLQFIVDRWLARLLARWLEGFYLLGETKHYLPLGDDLVPCNELLTQRRDLHTGTRAGTRTRAR